MKRLWAVCVLAIGAVISSACYVKQDEGGSWWACETYQTANGPADTCYALPGPPF